MTLPSASRLWRSSPRRRSAARSRPDPSCANVQPLRFEVSQVSRSPPRCQSPKWGSRYMQRQRSAQTTHAVATLSYATHSGRRLRKSACTFCQTTSCGLSSNVPSVTRPTRADVTPKQAHAQAGRKNTANFRAELDSVALYAKTHYLLRKLHRLLTQTRDLP
jgi:hypothetical protein